MQARPSRRPRSSHASVPRLSPAWRRRVQAALQVTETPCFVFSAEALESQWQRLQRAFRGLPVRHWWSGKTLPLPAALRWWRRQGQPVEVVSRFELEAVLAEKVPGPEVLVNGPAKHRWLPDRTPRGLRVNFDSLGELEFLAPRAAREAWSVGLRLNTAAERHPDFPALRTQFGLIPAELPRAAELLRAAGLSPEVVHFHLRTNVGAAADYDAAAQEAWNAVRAVGLQPRVLDVGGGFPVEDVVGLDGTAVDRDFDLRSMRDGVRRWLRTLPGLEEVWMENGRWLTAPAAVLVLRVLDMKEQRGARIAVCDGGRTLHALVATWERHRLGRLRPGRAPHVPTLVCGPTCMAFDHLGLHDLPQDLQAGDVLVWQEAGAYQLAWETQFSHGLSGIVWSEGGAATVLRRPRGFREWWSVRD